MKYQSDKLDAFISLMRLFWGYDTFGKYGVRQFLTSDAITIDPNYKNTGIIGELVGINGKICKTFGISLTSSIFMSDPINRIANGLRYKLNYDLR